MATVEDWTADDEAEYQATRRTQAAPPDEVARQLRRIANSLSTIAAVLLVGMVAGIIAGVLYVIM